MKVIGEAGRGNFIVMATSSELIQLGGLNWQGRIEVGDTIDVTELARRVEKLRRGWRDAQESAVALKALGELLEREIPKPEKEEPGAT